MSTGTRKVLRLLTEHGPLTPAQLAKRYFPAGHPGWQRHCKCGPKGSHRGSGLVLWAGGFLGKLRRAGLVTLTGDQYGPSQTAITGEGRCWLRKHEAMQTRKEESQA